MLLDKSVTFSDAQALTATADSTNVVDMGAAVNLAANGKTKCLLNLGAKGGTTPTIAALIQGADNEAMSSNAITIGTTGTLTDPALGNYEVPLANHAPKRYYRITYTCGGTNPTFTVTAGFHDAFQTQLAAFV